MFRIIYPDAYPDFVKSRRTLDELVGILTAVNLAYLPGREGGWTTRKEWRDVLSGGEKQRVSDFSLIVSFSNFCRHFYHSTTLRLGG